MSLYKSSQVIIEDTSESNPQHHLDDHKMGENDVVIFEEKPEPEDVIEVHRNPIDIEVSFKLPAIPGAPENAQVIEVSTDDPIEVSDKGENKKDDKNKLSDGKDIEAKDPWGWKGEADFIGWCVDKLRNIPKHSGKDTAGLERAIAYLKRLNIIISDAMRSDLDGKLDASQIEELRSQIEDGIDRLEERLSMLEDEKSKKRKKAAGILDPAIVKEAKQTQINGIIVTVPLLISSIARTCINGTVSGGRDIEDLFARQVKKYALNDREQRELIQLLDDMGFSMFRDRGFLVDDKEKYDPRSSSNYDFSANYHS